ncbi:hypothetical protein FRD01_19140 [Microvenator marinus]|uniref:Sporadically distributed protein, TIGR04141 family n=1 Tax=Microvenator marinus TaxID=2600177 RepID=A0A5B8Y0X3_9DELT|nr:DUF6119 family protein [Microvenator marinus]QED29309.1 hypothetical protein FRD01_19140 [Microvenator marinus]
MLLPKVLEKSSGVDGQTQGGSIEEQFDRQIVSESTSLPRPSGRGPNHDVSLYLAKEGVDLEAVFEGKGAEELEFDQEGVVGRFKCSRRKQPGWVGFFRKHLVSEIDLSVESVSVAIAFRVSERVFVVTFGGGRHLLDAAKLEPQFGLVVASHLIPIDEMHQLTSSTLSKFPQESRCTSLNKKPAEFFGIDLELEDVRKVVGASSDIVNRVAGSNHLKMHSFHGELSELMEVCPRFLECFAKGIEPSYEFLKNLTRVEKKDPRYQQLEAILEAEVAKTPTSFDLNVEGESWERTKNVRVYYGKSSEDCDFDTFIEAALRIAKKAGVPLGKVKLELSDEQDEALYGGAVLASLSGEVEHSERLYLIMAGRWFEIGESYVESLDDRIAALEQDWKLPAWKGSEDDYNKSVAEKFGWINLDKNLIQMGRSKGAFEAADLAGEDVLFHVKSGTSSAALNHLYGQIHTAAVLLGKSRAAREKLTEKSRTGRPIGFVAGIGREKSDGPLLGRMIVAKVGLLQCAANVRKLGFEFSVARIKIAKS